MTTAVAEIPNTLPAGKSIDWAREARRSRWRLYPVSVAYTAYAVTVFVVAFRSPRWMESVAFLAAGVAAFTLVEYLVHRYILHGRFPVSRNPVKRFLHKKFDHLHWEHHARPWDGNHINGNGTDTGPFVLTLIGLSFLAPFHTWPVFVAALMQSYIVEEWVHHSVHFYHFKNRYFWYIKRHHLYHHSPPGKNIAFGLTSGVWDVAFDTRIPADVRERLYARKRARRADPSPAV